MLLASDLVWLKIEPPDPFWPWVERASWAVTIVGGLIALITLGLLFLDQRRIANEVSRRAVIRLGLVLPNRPLIPRNLELTHTFLQRFSGQRLVIGFGVANEGTRTAVGLNHELIFPASVAEASSIDGRSFADGSGFVHLTWGPEDLHPRSGITHYAFLTVRRDISRIVVQSSATFQDSPKVEAEIELILQVIP